MNISCVAGDRFKEGFVVAMKELVDAWSLPKRTVIFVIIVIIVIVFIVTDIIVTLVIILMIVSEQ